MRTTTCPRTAWRGPGDARLPVDALVVDPAGAARNAQTGKTDLDFFALAPPHGYGMRPIAETDPALVTMQIDLGWTYIAGVDPHAGARPAQLQLGGAARPERSVLLADNLLR